MPRKQRFKPSRKPKISDGMAPMLAPIPTTAPIITSPSIVVSPRGPVVLPDHHPEPTPTHEAPRPIPRGRDAVIDD